MLTRREIFGAIALLTELAASIGSADAQTAQSAPQPARGPVFKHDLPDLTIEGWEVTVSYVDYPPERVGTAHKHPGFVLAYVLEGTVTTNGFRCSKTPRTTSSACTRCPLRHPGGPRPRRHLRKRKEEAEIVEGEGEERTRSAGHADRDVLVSK